MDVRECWLQPCYSVGALFPAADSSEAMSRRGLHGSQRGSSTAAMAVQGCTRGDIGQLQGVQARYGVVRLRQFVSCSDVPGLVHKVGLSIVLGDNLPEASDACGCAGFHVKWTDRCLLQTSLAKVVTPQGGMMEMYT